MQQGNVITQEQVNELKPGMSPDQVRYLLGTPSLADSFHNNRWDYHYELHEGSGATSQQRLTLFFQDNQLAQIQGDLRPIPDQQPVPLEQRYPTVVVPPRQEELGFLEILWRKMGFGDTQ